jgi:hypothetical protein
MVRTSQKWMLTAALLCLCCCPPCTNPLPLTLPRDINTVNGVPFPEMPLLPKSYRFRFVNSAVSRPWLLKIKDAFGRDVSQTMCYIIASDGGYRSPPVPWPAEGLQIGVAERYEAVCDFSAFANQKLYLFNGRNGECVTVWVSPCSLLLLVVCSAVPANCAWQHPGCLCLRLQAALSGDYQRGSAGTVLLVSLRQLNMRDMSGAYLVALQLAVVLHC